MMVTLDFLKEILSAHALRNNPSANYFYEFDIVAFEHSIDATDFMRTKFALKDNKELAVNEITESEFKKAIHKWFFECESSKNLNIIHSERSENVENFFSSLKSVTKGEKIYHFQNVNKGLYEYQLGIYFDYFYMEGQENNFLIYFSMQD